MNYSNREKFNHSVDIPKNITTVDYTNRREKIER